MTGYPEVTYLGREDRQSSAVKEEIAGRTFGHRSPAIYT
jgi:hypothetical protein